MSGPTFLFLLLVPSRNKNFQFQVIVWPRMDRNLVGSKTQYRAPSLTACLPSDGQKFRRFLHLHIPTLL